MAGAKRTQKATELIGMGDQPRTENGGAELTMREESLPAKLRAWREKLSVKAKQEKRYRFYSLYGLVSHPATLEAAWNQVRAKGGAPGVDGVTIEHRARRVSRFSGANRQGTSREDLSLPAGATGLYREGQWEEEAAGHTHGKRPGGASGGAVDPRTDL